ncbi:nucleotidyltransferase domain-containing protein [Thermithiobacillus plumbiphilus]|uniref:Nucleotidyltransferase domain-containing protein n=1 Tax=Thermithiobacillus plumbiphilus TaxID=1729899 RepID=A0ABU9DAT3_9PROT
MDPITAQATRIFLEKVRTRYSVAGAFLFGSRARGDFRPDSDLDIAVLLQGARTSRVDAALEMADLAFDVLMDTGILIEAFPLWETEWEHPEQFNNPALIENIRREGLRL